MRATKFEFEHRFWVIAGIYAAGFALPIFHRTTFIVWLRHLIAPAIAANSPQSAMFAQVVIVAGAFLVLLTAALRTWGAAYLRTDVVHDTEQHSETLVADGPFRFTRNPLYFASVPMAAGIGVLASPLGFVFLVLANWIFVYRLIFREEEALLKSQGESYRAYLKAVPRFWPSLRPRVRSGNIAPKWGQAFAGESFVWLFGLAELAMAATLSATIGVIAFSLGFVAHFIISRGIQKRRGSHKQGDAIPISPSPQSSPEQGRGRRRDTSSGSSEDGRR